MTGSKLQVVLAEKGSSKAGITLRSMCAGAGYTLDVVIAQTGRDLTQELFAHSPDLALVDLSLLQPDAPRQLGSLHSAHPAIPLILFADPADRACAAECLSMGAADFLLEGFMDERTMTRVLHSAVGQGLTNKMKHRAADGYCGKAIDAAGRKAGSESTCSPGSAEAAGVLWIWLYGWELARDPSASAEVDRILGEMGDLLRMSIRKEDLTRRLEGGGFAVHLQCVRETDHETIRRRLLARLKDYQSAFAPASRGEISISVRSSFDAPKVLASPWALEDTKARDAVKPRRKIQETDNESRGSK